MPETYGTYGGRYVPETLVPALDELTGAWEDALADASFHAELDALATSYAGRPTPLTRAERLFSARRWAQKFPGSIFRSPSRETRSRQLRTYCASDWSSSSTTKNSRIRN